MAIQVPFPLPSTGYALNSKVRINLDFLVDVFNEFNTGSASWDQVVIGTQNTLTGTLSFYNASNSYYIQFQPSTSSTSNQSYTLPVDEPTVAPSVLTSSTGGVMTWKQLKGTENQITVTDNAADVTLSYTNPSGLGRYVALFNATTGSGLLDDQVDGNDGHIFRMTISGLTSLTGNSTIVLPAPASGSIAMVTEAGAAFTGSVSVNELSTFTAYDIRLRPASGSGRTILNQTATNSNITWNLPAAQGAASQVLSNDGSGNLTWDDIGALGGTATPALDNLASVAINTSLISDTSLTDDLGSSSKLWKNAYVQNMYLGINGNPGQLVLYPNSSGAGSFSLSPISNSGDYNVNISNVAASGHRQVSIPDAGAATSYFVLSQPGLSMPTGNGTSGQVLTTDGSGAATWEDAATGGTVYREDYIVGTAANNYTGSTTVFDLNATYTTGDSSMLVYVDGVLQTIGATVDYVETDTNTVTFNNALVSGQKVGFVWSVPTSATDYATKALDNLGSVAINTSLISDTDNTDDLGSSTKAWKDAYLKGSLDISNGNIAIVGGADGAASTRTDDTIKNFRCGVAHYDNEDLPATVFFAQSGTTNVLNIGGGTASMNAMTTVNIRTAADNSTATGTTALSVSGTGEVTQPLQPCFLVTAPTNTANQTGDATVFTVEFDTEVVDQGADFNTGTYTFTAPVSGVYLLQAGVMITGLASGHTGAFVLRIATSNRTYGVNQQNAWAAGGDNTISNSQLSCVADMDAGDTAYVNITVSGSTKVVEVFDDARNSYFSGSLIN